MRSSLSHHRRVFSDALLSRHQSVFLSQTSNVEQCHTHIATAEKEVQEHAEKLATTSQTQAGEKKTQAETGLSKRTKYYADQAANLKENTRKTRT